MEIESLEVFSRTTHLVEVAQLEGFFRKKATLPEENLKLARSSMRVGPSSWEIGPFTSETDKKK
jgi:hypothetical protein